MTKFDLLNLIGMFEHDLRATLELIQLDKFDKASCKLREMIHTVEKLRKTHDVDKPYR